MIIDGEEIERFACEFYIPGDTWRTFPIWAKDEADAAKVTKKMAQILSRTPWLTTEELEARTALLSV